MPDFDNLGAGQDEDVVPDDERRRRERAVTDDDHTAGAGSDEPGDPVMPADDSTLNTKI